MLHYRRYGFVFPEGETFAGALARVFQVSDDAGMATAPLRFLFEDTPGGTGCSRIVEQFPEFAPFAVSTKGVSRLSNLDGRWEGGNPEAGGEPAWETLLAAAEGIPAEFPVWIASVLIGPVLWGGASNLTLREASAGRTST